MDDSGSEAVVKRQRLDSYDNGHSLSHRTLQQPPATTYGSGYPGNNAIPPPHLAYPRGPPQSPYHEVNPTEHRALPEPHPYPPTAPGYNTPGREPRRFSTDNLYSRPGSVSAPNRSPDDIQQHPHPRPPPINTSNSDTHRYPPHQVEHGGPAPAYPSYENQPNGNAHGLPMSTFGDANQGHPQGHVVPYNHSPVHPAQYSYNSTALDSPSVYMGVPKQRRGNRATQACDVCRNRKAKCNEGKPKCVYCTKEGLECVYQEVPPAKADRANQAILDQLADLQSEVQAQKTEVMQANQQHAKQLERIERILSNMPSSRLLSPTVDESHDSDIKLSPTVTNIGSPESKVELPQPEPMTKRPALIQNRDVVSKRIEKDPIPTLDTEFDEDTATVTVEHTTAAHRLLSWPSIKALLNPNPYSEHYVMRMEDAKGVLRVFGRGQGRDRDDGGQPISVSSSPSTQSDDLPESRNPASPPEGLWGTGLNTATTMETLHTVRGTDGGLNQDGSLRVDILTLRRFLKSYLDNFHVMHPFMDKVKLNKWVNAFGLRYNARDARIPFASSVNQMHPNFSRDSPTSLSRAGKRKHADGMHPSYSPEAPIGKLPLKPAFEKSIKSATVFLIMALGMIAEHTQPLPGPAADGTANVFASQKGHSPAASLDSPPNSIARQSTRSTSQSTNSTSAASPMSFIPNDHITTTKSAAEALSVGPKNMDIIPGLAYFAQATEILGALHGGNELVHVQAYLLAGLYMGQLARTFESYSWIESACNVCRYLVRDPCLNHIKEPANKDLTKFAFWTCLQLESDILAELDLPQSGIKDITGVGYPVGYVEQVEGPANLPDNTTKMMLFYSAQLRLRACLNEIQNNLYPPDRDHFECAKNPTSLRDAHHGTLEDWRTILPDALKWHDSEPPSTDINHARLRAKYYGALYIIHRPFLRHALLHNLVPDDSPGGRRNTSSNGRFRRHPSSADYADRPPGPMGPPSISSPASVNSEILRSAHICVEAAIASSLAFDGIAFGRRLIVTNIFGTAHAQFGNMLVLSATFKSPLGYLIPESKLKRLLERTIMFLRILRHISATLEHDLKILERIESTIFQPKSNSHSFSHDE